MTLGAVLEFLYIRRSMLELRPFQQPIHPLPRSQVEFFDKYLPKQFERSDILELWIEEHLLQCLDKREQPEFLEFHHQSVGFNHGKSPRQRKERHTWSAGSGNRNICPESHHRIRVPKCSTVLIRSHSAGIWDPSVNKCPAPTHGYKPPQKAMCLNSSPDVAHCGKCDTIDLIVLAGEDAFDNLRHVRSDRCTKVRNDDADTAQNSPEQQFLDNYHIFYNTVF